MSSPEPVAPLRVGLVSVHTSPLAQPGSGDGGGMNVVVASLARELAAGGMGVEVYTRGTEAHPPGTTDVDGYRVHTLEVGPPSLRKDDLASHLCAFALAVLAHPTAAALDLIHSHYWMSGWVGRHIAPRLGVPLAASFHTLARTKNAHLAPGDAPEPALRLVGEERVVRDADAVVANTAAEADLLHRHYGASSGSVHVIEPGVDLATFRPDGPVANLGPGRIVLYVGRLQALKAPDDAVRALAALPADVDGEAVRLVLVGGPSGSHGSDPAALMHLADRLGVGDRVEILAPRRQRELAAMYRRADCVIVPSHSESFGLVALEAQACGTPAVVADVAGLRAALGPGAGTVVPGRDPRAWARALHTYLDDPEAARRAGRAGMARAARSGWAQSATQTAELYRSLTVGSRRYVASQGA